MNEEILNKIAQLTGAQSATLGPVLQSLWSGYGEIVRCYLMGADVRSVVVKRIGGQGGAHPRGWHSDIGHQRKLRSYEVEVHWYRQWAHQCGENCRVPKCYGVLNCGDETVIILEDLDAAGFSQRRSQLNITEVKACLTWLADFHGRFLQCSPTGLWPVGCYWHLATRPDELAAMAVGPLQERAGDIDNLLNRAHYQTLVHGDAKVANFCFADSNGGGVAAVDFQYVGGGCGIRDVAYFLGSCLSSDACRRNETDILAYYFDSLRQVLALQQPAIDAVAVEAEWRSLYPVAWADFQRFLLGWMPDHQKINAYSQALTDSVLAQLGS